MLTTKSKSALQKKLQDAQLACAHIRVLTELRSEMHCAKGNQGSEHLEWYGDAYHGSAIEAGIAALADQIDSQIDDVHSVLSKEAEPA
jgi:hypothetical protein